MSFGTMLYTLLFKPLEMLFEVIFSFAYRIIGNPGLSIIALSLAMNFLVLPLYRRADAMQEEECDIENKLHAGVAHIKKTFKGDEKTMMLQTYYRQNNYSPTQILRSAVSLFLEIPFFIAAYNFLSSLQILNGVAFGPIADLSKPDSLFMIGTFSVNILPVLMTVINIISTVIFTKGHPLKTKIQLYGMAAFFLVFLYDSPAGLVFYWTLNNVFSLVKTIFYKLKNPKRVLCILGLICGIPLIAFGVYHEAATHLWKQALLIAALGLALALPFVISQITKSKPQKKLKEAEPNKKLFFLGGLLLAVLIGAVIPSAVIKSSVGEFVDSYYFVHPFWYIVSAMLLSIGTFVIWFGVFYGLASKKAKVIFEKAVWVLCGVALVDYLFFGNNLGILSTELQYINGMTFTSREQLINLAVIAGVITVFWFIAVKLRKHLHKAVAVVMIALLIMSGVNTAGIFNSVTTIKASKLTSDDEPHFSLSKNGKNVVVILLDRAYGLYIPYIFNEKPELKEKYAGFTYYDNVISYGMTTNIGSPAFYGGYEYTPAASNARSDVSLKDKQNEALKVMPTNFVNAGYEVTVCDPTFANYSWVPDLSIFDDDLTLADIKKYNTIGYFNNSNEVKQSLIENRFRNFFSFGITKSTPLVAQGVVYNNGLYNQFSSTSASSQVAESLSVANGTNQDFIKSYNTLQNMSGMTRVSEGSENTFLMFYNEAPHMQTILQEPDYVPAEHVDNTEYDAAHADRFTYNGRTLAMTHPIYHMGNYHSNMASLIQVANWLDYLRENDLYNNTRIIIAADHGVESGHTTDLVYGDGSGQAPDLGAFFPLLMVKDFNSTEFTTDSTFMTNADVPTLAMEGVIENPINPATGNPINSDEKTAHDQLLLATYEFDINTNNGNQFLPDQWYSVHDSIWDKSNWSIVAEKAVLTQ